MKEKEGREEGREKRGQVGSSALRCLLVCGSTICYSTLTFCYASTGKEKRPIYWRSNPALGSTELQDVK